MVSTEISYKHHYHVRLHIDNNEELTMKDDYLTVKIKVSLAAVALSCSVERGASADARRDAFSRIANPPQSMEHTRQRRF